jgi:hypothetical protein
LQDDTALHTLLERSYTGVLTRLEQLTGKQEWTLRLWLRAQTASAEPIQGGRAYLQARRDTLSAQAAHEQQAATLRQHLADFLDTEDILYSASERLPANDADYLGACEVIVLLSREQEHALQQHYNANTAVKLELSGPFAPYTFSTIDSTINTADTTPPATASSSCDLESVHQHTSHGDTDNSDTDNSDTDNSDTDNSDIDNNGDDIGNSQGNTSNTL